MAASTFSVQIRALLLAACTATVLLGCATTPPPAGDTGSVSRIEEDHKVAERIDRGEFEDFGESGKQDNSLPPAEDVVVDVLKGDELVLQSGWVVRLVSVDTPTADYGKRTGNFYGKQAIDYLKQRVQGKKVTLEYDIQQTDSYGRALAYISDSSGSINEALLEKGFALSVCFPPNVSRCGDYAELAQRAIRDKVGLWNFDPAKWANPDAENQAGTSKRVTVFVKEVLDGDTVRLEDGTTVRYIGIDAPESELVWRDSAYGNESWKRNRALVEGKEVELEYDAEFRDPRGRELAYVYVDGKMVNKTLVEEGLAWVAVFPPNVRHIKEMFEAQDRAADSARGIWNIKSN